MKFSLLLKLSCAFLFLALLSSCKDDSAPVSAVLESKSGEAIFKQEDFKNELRSMLANRPAIENPSFFQKDLAFVYAQGENAPIWLTENGISAAGQQLLNDLDSLSVEGLDSKAYQLAELKSNFANFKEGKSKKTLAELVAWDTTCTAAYLQASRDLLIGRLIPRKADSLWFHSNDSTWTAPENLIAQAKDNTKYTPLANYRSRLPAYKMLHAEALRLQQLKGDSGYLGLKNGINGQSGDSLFSALLAKELPWKTGGNLENALKEYQGFYALKITGIADSATLKMLTMPVDSQLLRLSANMERLRWMEQNPEAQYVFVNIPQMEMVFRKGPETLVHMRTVVGKPARQTPSLNADMTNVVFNPPWGVPPTIRKREVIPGVMRSGGGYLRRKGLQAFDRRGRKVDPRSINSGNVKSLNFRQPPGARNALGDVKFNLPNKYDIYLHDTPHREDFPLAYRAKSSGCIRLAQPRQFAEFILNTIEGRDFDQQSIDSIVNRRVTKIENLKNKIPVHIVYLTACEDSTGSHVQYVADVYKKDRKLMNLLR